MFRCFSSSFHFLQFRQIQQNFRECKQTSLSLAFIHRKASIEANSLVVQLDFSLPSNIYLHRVFNHRNNHKTVRMLRCLVSFRCVSVWNVGCCFCFSEEKKVILNRPFSCLTLQTNGEKCERTISNAHTRTRKKLWTHALNRSHENLWYFVENVKLFIGRAQFELKAVIWTY